MFTKLDKAIINLISQDIPLVKEPFKDLALKLGIKQELLLHKISCYKKNGFLRKYTANLNHKKIGFTHNAMVVWNIPQKVMEKTGLFMAGFRQVSHCYERKKTPDWDYNLYSMIHGRTKRECFDVIEEISRKIKCRDYRVLFSSCEYKKSAARYYNN